MKAIIHWIVLLLFVGVFATVPNVLVDRLCGFSYFSWQDLAVFVISLLCANVLWMVFFDWRFEEWRNK